MTQSQLDWARERRTKCCTVYGRAFLLLIPLICAGARPEIAGLAIVSALAGVLFLMALYCLELGDYTRTSVPTVGFVRPSPTKIRDCLVSRVSCSVGHVAEAFAWFVTGSLVGFVIQLVILHG